MRVRYLRWIYCFFLMSFFLLAWPVMAKAQEEADFRLIGYYSADLFDEPVEQLPFGQLTHIMYAFLIPAEDGSIAYVPETEKLRRLVEMAHLQDTEVFIAVGGWSYQNIPLAPVFEKMACSEDSRKVFISNLMDFVKEYNLDGVELDWEYPQASSAQAYEALVMELADALHQEQKELTAALSGAWAADAGPEVSMLVTEKCLEAFDFIEIMGYDMNDADHSPYWFSQTSLAYWANRGVPAHKMVLGVPLYARPSWLQYRQLVAADPANAWRNYVPAGTLSNQESYYNGLPLLRAKTMLTLKQGGGMMLFDVNEDTRDAYSVVSMMAEEAGRYQLLGPDAYQQKIWLYLHHRLLPLSLTEHTGDCYLDENNRILIPLRIPLEAIGAQVQYDDKTQQITITKDNLTLQLRNDVPGFTINGQQQTMDTKPRQQEGRTYIPARPVLEALGYQVQWDPDSRTIFIS